MLRFLLVAAIAGAAPATATELVVNGSFSAGNTGFSSDYAYHVGQGHGVYDLAATPLSADDAYPDWGTYGDHTTGTGTMLVADGSTTAGQNVWAESLMLTAGQTYTYSFWGRQNDASSGSNPSLAFLVGGIATGTPLAVSSASADGWQQATGTFTANAGGTTTVAIRDLNTSGPFNDFSLDDISVTAPSAGAVPEPAAWVLMSAGFGLSGAMVRRRVSVVIAA